MNSIYPVFTNFKTKKKLIFYPVKKNANTSAKLFFLKHLGIEKNFFFLEDKFPRHMQNKEMHAKYIGKDNLIEFMANNTKFRKIDSGIKSCIVREPLKRFISAYKNRILFHKDKEFYNHTIDEVLEKLENNFFENRHFLPQTFFLGDDLKYFDIVGNVENITEFEKKINNFFERNVKFPQLQTGGNIHKLKLTPDQIIKIEKIYDIDYDLLQIKKNR